MSISNICIAAAILVYLGSVLLIGIRYAKKSESVSDFYLGGRRLGPIVTAMSAEASDMSNYLLMGLPGLAYLSGLADVGWTMIGLAMGTYLNWLLTARYLRRYTHITGSYTLPQFFSRRFRDERHILSGIAAVIIIVFFIPYTASGFAACGKLFSTMFGMDYMTAMILSAIIIVGYTAAGGFLAASVTDFVQSIMMTAALLFVLIFSVHSAGGLDVVLENAKALPGFFSMTTSYAELTGTSEPYDLLHIFTTLSWGLGYFGMPHILLRFMAIEDENKLKLSRRVASIWVTVAMGVVLVIGIAGRTLSRLGVIPELFGNKTETIIVQISGLLSGYGVAAALMAGVILAGMLASTMSTADSQLLAASSSVSQNILQEKLRLGLTEKQSMLAARLTVVLIAIFGVIIARNPDSSIFGIVSFAWAGFGAGFGPLIICALFWRRTTLQGAIAGMLSGGGMVFLWKYFVKPLGGVFGIYELLPAFLTGILVMIVVSLLTKAPAEEILREFDTVHSKKSS